MKTKDIIAVTLCALVIAGSIYYILKLSSPAKPKTEEKTEAEKISEEFTGELDKYKDTLEEVSKFTDYGKPPLDGIGRANPFAPL